MTTPGDDTRVNAWGRSVPRTQADTEPTRLPMFYSEPPENARELLNVLCGSCYVHMASVFDDDHGGLWLATVDRLRDWIPGDNDRPGVLGDYWTNAEAEPITDPDQWLYSGCRKATSRQCGRAYSWRLSDWQPNVAKARATGKRVTIRL